MGTGVKPPGREGDHPPPLAPNLGIRRALPLLAHKYAYLTSNDDDDDNNNNKNNSIHLLICFTTPKDIQLLESIKTQHKKNIKYK
jgi:hypothetical protein